MPEVIITMRFVSVALLAMLAVSIHAKPIIIAHRGAPFYAPENTTPSMQLALDLGADGLETDVYRTIDDKVMVMHDRTTSRTASGVNHDMKKTPSDVLEKIDVGSYKHACFKGTMLPYIEDIVKMTPKDKLLVVEIKDQPDTVAPLKKILVDSGKPWSAFTIISFNFDTCEEARKQMPEVEVYYLESARDKKTKQPKMFKSDILKRAKDANLSGVNLDFHGVSEELVKESHDMGMKFLVWTVDNEEDIKRMTRYGVDAITTNLCDRARRYVDEVSK